jgi:hypothetical protein
MKRWQDRDRRRGEGLRREDPSYGSQSRKIFIGIKERSKVSRKRLVAVLEVR